MKILYALILIILSICFTAECQAEHRYYRRRTPYYNYPYYQRTYPRYYYQYRRDYRPYHCPGRYRYYDPYYYDYVVPGIQIRVN